MIWLIKTIVAVLLVMWVLGLITSHSVWAYRDMLFTVLIVVVLIKVIG